MTHEERIKKSDELIAQMKKLIKDTKEKLKRMDDENTQRINLTENQANILRKRS